MQLRLPAFLSCFTPSSRAMSGVVFRLVTAPLAASNIETEAALTLSGNWTMTTRALSPKERKADSMLPPAFSKRGLTTSSLFCGLFIYAAHAAPVYDLVSIVCPIFSPAGLVSSDPGCRVMRMISEA